MREGQEEEGPLAHQEDCYQIQVLTGARGVMITVQWSQVRLCAEGCRIQEGPLTCQELQVATRRDTPTEECQLVPHKSCRSLHVPVPVQ